MSPSLQLCSPVQTLSIASSIATTFAEGPLGLWVGFLMHAGTQLAQGARRALPVLPAHCLPRQALPARTLDALPQRCVCC